MKRIIILLALCLAGLMPAHAEAFSTAQAGLWMTNFYIDKDTTHVSDFMQWVAGFDFQKQPNTAPQVTGFLAGMFSENPKKIHGWVTDLSPTPAAKDVIERALWLSGHSDEISAVFHDAPGYAARKAPSVTELPLSTPESWDMMWANFAATGNTAGPARLIDLIPESVTLSPDAATNTHYHQIVLWSLMSNMRQHARILRMVHQEADRRTGHIQQMLQEILKALEGNHVDAQACNGDFCATEALISKENLLEEQQMPTDQTPVLTELEETHNGMPVMVTLSFTGFAMAGDLSTDVRYDLRVTGPDGHVHGKVLSGLIALKQKVPNNFNIFDNQPDVPMIRFTPEDPRGTYQIETDVTDAIGHKTLKLVKKITLKGPPARQAG